jgi:two-component system, LytTR family, sensor kinase
MKLPFIHRTPGLVLQYIFASLLVLALAGFTHLSIVIIYDINGNAKTYMMALLSAFGNGLVIMFSVLIFRTWFKNLQHPFWKYFWLNLCMLVLNFCLNYLLFIVVVASAQIDGNIDASANKLSFLYSLHPLMVGSLIMYFTDREQFRTRKITEQEYQLLQLKELKTKAELEALQAKINPHFLYNSLNSIASLVHIDPDRAEQMVMLLSRFFRYSTSVKNQYFHTIGEEIEMVTTYLDVEKVRFDERLNYEIQFTDENLKNSLIPRFLLQPLAENAIKHGISKVAYQGKIEISISRQQEYVQIIIHDNGPAFPQQLTTSYGLQSTSDKLRMLCGEDARMEIVNGEYKHLKITLKYQPAFTSEPPHTESIFASSN